MTRSKLADWETATTFGQRKFAPRVCIADRKRHIRTFLHEALEEFGFLISECATAADLPTALDLQMPDLMVVGLPNDGHEAGNILKILVVHEYRGKVLLIGPRDSSVVKATHKLGEEFGIAMLPPLATPFSAEGLRASLAALFPRQSLPDPVIGAAEAVNAGWLELWYQPKVDATTLMPRGAEAQVRLRHPVWGLVPPSSLVADGSDPQFSQLSEFVIRRLMTDWLGFASQQGPIDLAIKLPISFLANPASVSLLCRQVSAHPLGGLIVNIDCAEIIDNLDLAIDVARRTRFHNVAIAVDNLGVFWPSLTGLPNFPFVELKVDQEFIGGIADDRMKQMLCRHILDLANSYGARAVAKGVETRDDFAAARDMGFRLAQGDLFGTSVNAETFARISIQRPVRMSR